MSQQRPIAFVGLPVTTLSVQTHPSMRVLFVILLAPVLCTTSLAVQAQQWCPPGAEWSHGYQAINWGTGETHVGTLLARYSGDEVIGGHSAQRIDQELFYEVIGAGEQFHVPWATAYTRSSEGVIWLWNAWSEQYDTLVWTGAVPGDRWSVPLHGEPDLFHLVMDTATIIMQGVPLRRISVSTIYAPFGPTPVDYDTLYERIGSTGYSSFNPPHPAADGFNIFFRCYRDDGFAHSLAGTVDCGFTVAMDEVGYPAHINAYPNPGHDRVRFSGLELGTWQASIFDAQGVLVLQGNLREGQELDVAALAPGFYSLALLAPNGIRHWLKWVKE